MAQKILVVDDEKPILDIISFNLDKEGFAVVEASDGEEALSKALSLSPDLVLLDVMLPKMSGFDVLKKIREKSMVPVLMLTAKEEEVDKVLGLELGADDYITKPFKMRELIARIKANLRRTSVQETSAADAPDTLTAGSLEICFERYEVKKDGRVVELTFREFELLKYLSTQAGKIFTREVLLEKVWGYEYYGDVRTVDVTIRRLREKIEEDAANPVHVMTKRGVGYYFAL